MPLAVSLFTSQLYREKRRPLAVSSPLDRASRSYFSLGSRTPTSTRSSLLSNKLLTLMSAARLPGVEILADSPVKLERFLFRRTRHQQLTTTSEHVGRGTDLWNFPVFLYNARNRKLQPRTLRASTVREPCTFVISRTWEVLTREI